jgi:class 3 adenylate cyclase
LGDSGEAYIAGQDGTMRSTARPFQEAPGEFLAASKEPGPGQLTDDQRRLIAATDTTALVQGVNRGVLTLAASGAGTIDTTDYRGVDVLTAYRDLDIAGLDWVILTDFPTNELNQPIERYARHMLLAVALFVVIVTFVAVRWSNRLMAPIRTIANRLRSVRADPGGDHDVVEGQLMPANSPEEYDELALNIDQMLRRLQSHQRSVTERSQERARLLRRFLPAGVAKRSEDGDGEVIDHVRNVTVVVVLLDGVGQLSDQRPEQALRTTLADLVDEADALATEFGLERIKITGGMYVAVCGASRPYLDHAPRGVAFALGVADLVAHLSGGAPLMRVGVDTGEILVGLAGRTGLVYDAWGSAVEGAEHLANGAPAGGVTVSAAVHRQLPDDFVIAGDGDGSEPVVVTARIRDGAGR